MKNERGRWGGRQLTAAMAIAVLGLVGVAVGVSLAARAPETAAEPIVAAPKAAARESNSSKAGAAGVAGRKQMAIPVRISIPAIGVNARVIPLGLNRDRTIQVPKNLADSGWFRPGPEPGEQGAAVVVGHVASRSGPGVFVRLGELRPGRLITIHLQDGTRVRFAARSMIRVRKNRFPTKRVYAKTTRTALRLITCAGKLDPATGHHPDNYIVFASIVR